MPLSVNDTLFIRAPENCLLRNNELYLHVTSAKRRRCCSQASFNDLGFHLFVNPSLGIYALTFAQVGSRNGY